MKADFSRETFDKGKHYASVLMQQGRVQVDADWNEQQAIMLHRMETTAADVIGISGGPANDAGFEIFTDPKKLDDQDRKYLEARFGSLPADKRPVDLSDSFELTTPGDFFISRGRYYVDGILCENENVAIFTQQPDLPGAEPLTTGTYIVYLDVWLRHITALDDPVIREIALGGGADTCARTKVVWQVRLARENELEELTSASNGRLSAKAEPVLTEDPLLPSGARYQGIENQLYRVEIHQAGSSGSIAPTFKWSRDNGSVVTAIEIDKDGKPNVTGNKVVVQSLGPDRVLWFAADQWIEIVDDSTELRGEPGPLLQIDTVDARTITLKQAPDPSKIGSHPKIRRWDQGATATERGVDITLEDRLGQPIFQSLEDGVEVSFSDGAYKAGDYWLIPARTATGDIEWPVDAHNNPIAQPPLGIKHHYCRLAEIVVDGGRFTSVNDLRESFNPMADNLVAKVIVGQSANAIVLRNGDTIKGGDLANGLEISLHRSIDPASATRATCFVTLEVPYHKANAMVGFQPIALAANVSADAMRIRWHPTDEAKVFLRSLSRDSATFTKEWEVIPSDQADTNWNYDSVVAKGKASEGLDGITGTLKGQMAVHQSPLRGAAQRLRFSAIPPAAAAQAKIVGLVFNYRSRPDFWLISAELKAGEEKTVVASVVHFEDGQRPHDQSKRDSFPEVQKIQSIDIEYDSRNAKICYKGLDLPGGRFVQRLDGINRRLDESLQVGVITSFSEPTTFNRLSVSYSGTEEIILPRSEDVGKLVSLLTIRRQFLTPGSTARSGRREQALGTALADASMWFWIEPDAAQQ